MEPAEVVFKRKTAVTKDILAHLEACNDGFHPPLSERIDLEEYARKVFEKAETFEAWNGGRVIGLVAAYFNNDANHSAYVTNVSVLPAFMRLGIASRLLQECVEYAVEKNFREIKLEVAEGNEQAISMYRRSNFIPDGDHEGFLKMKLNIKPG